MPKTMFRCARCGFCAFVDCIDELLRPESGWVILNEKDSFLCPACRADTSTSPDQSPRAIAASKVR
jgi:hypothetical protein